MTKVQTMANIDKFYLHIAGSFVRWRHDCHKLKDGQKHKRVRQIEEVVDERGQDLNAARMVGLSVLHR